MQITGLPPTRFDLPGRANPVYIATLQWALEPWQGEDPPDLGRSWTIKPKFAVNGNRSGETSGRKQQAASRTRTRSPGRAI